MRAVAALLALGLSCSSAASVSRQDDGFSSLFDETSLRGWTARTGKATYRVEDGAVVGRTATEGPNTFLCTNRAYDNFDLRLELKCDPGLNSGIQIRSAAYERDTPQASKPNRIRPAGTVRGPQVEISANGNAGRIWDEARHTKWLDAGPSEEAKKAYRPGEWNRYRIVARGNRYQTWINDVSIADFRNDEDVSGFIGLQVHSIRKNTGPFEVRWRNIRIREISVNPGFNKRFATAKAADFVARWEKEGREVYDRREDVVKACGIAPGMTVGDIGSGTGLFTRLFASRAEKVYAVDIAKDFVRHVEESARAAGLKNVEGVVCAQDDVRLPPNSIDLAFICNTYHHFEYPRRTLTSVRRALREGGRMIIVEFRREKGVSSDFVMDHVRAGKATTIKEVEASGFRLAGEEPLLKKNYFLVFKVRK